VRCILLPRIINSITTTRARGMSYPRERERERERKRENSNGNGVRIREPSAQHPNDSEFIITRRKPRIAGTLALPLEGHPICENDFCRRVNQGNPARLRVLVNCCRYASSPSSASPSASSFV
jgi:hypothetical protein